MSRKRTITIAAPKDLVFRAVADIEHLPETVSVIQRVEFITDQRQGVGTRFRETRLHDGKETVTELEVTEWGDDRARMVADSHGTVWDTLFEVRAIDANSTELTVTSDTRPHNPLAWLMTVLFSGMIAKKVDEHFVEGKAWCEGRASSDATRSSE